MVGSEGEEPFTLLHAVITLRISTCKGGWSGIPLQQQKGER